VNIRPATPEDVNAILALERACDMAAHWSEAEYARIFEDDGVARVLFVADDGGVSGFIVARTAGPDWEIENIAVEPARRGRGIGRELVDAVIAEAKAAHADAIALEVRESNSPARALYRHCGFSEIGRRPRYYSNPDEAAVLYCWSPFGA
jgi:ribosomal-protein-alanine N-acetyltransferase